MVYMDWPASHAGRDFGAKLSRLTAESEAELHAFAAEIGLPRRAFKGDRYELTEEMFWVAAKYGAAVVSARRVVEVRGRLMAAINGPLRVYDPALGTGGWPLQVGVRR